MGAGVNKLAHICPIGPSWKRQRFCFWHLQGS